MRIIFDQAPKRVALYLRVSTEDQAERGTIQAQRDYLVRRAELEGWDVTGVYDDDGISGTLPLAGRVARPDGTQNTWSGAQLLQDARAGRFDEVVVWRVDRLARSLHVLMDAYTSLEDCGVTIRSATEPFDTSTPIGKFLFQLLGSMAELEKATISERLTGGRDRAVRAGKWTGGPIPFGYDLDAPDADTSPDLGAPTKNRSRRLVPSGRIVEGLDETEARVARSVFERLAAGSSTIAEAIRLNALCVPTGRRYGGGRVVTIGTHWLPSRINFMVRNPIYKGLHVFKSRGGIIERAVEPLVSPEMWEQANAQISRNRALSTRNAKRLYLLRGLIRCGECGIGFSGTGAHNRRAHTYRCSGQLGVVQPDARRRCRAKTLRADWIEQLVWQECRDFILHPEAALAEVQKQLRERMGRSAGLEGERERLVAVLEGIEERRRQVKHLWTHKLAAWDETEHDLSALNREADALRAQIDGIDAERSLTNSAEAHHAEAATLLARLRKGLAAIESTDYRAAKRDIIAALVAGVRVETHGEGHHKRAVVTVEYSFTPNASCAGVAGTDIDVRSRHTD